MLWLLPSNNESSDLIEDRRSERNRLVSGTPGRIPVPPDRFATIGRLLLVVTEGAP